LFRAPCAPLASTDRKPCVVAPVFRKDLLGVVAFNFAFCVTLPSWMNEKRASVSVVGALRRRPCIFDTKVGGYSSWSRRALAARDRACLCVPSHASWSRETDDFRARPTRHMVVVIS